MVHGPFDSVQWGLHTCSIRTHYFLQRERERERERETEREREQGTITKSRMDLVAAQPVQQTEKLPGASAAHFHAQLRLDVEPGTFWSCFGNSEVPT